MMIVIIYLLSIWVIRDYTLTQSEHGKTLSVLGKA